MEHNGADNVLDYLFTYVEVTLVWDSSRSQYEVFEHSDDDFPIAYLYATSDGYSLREV